MKLMILAEGAQGRVAILFAEVEDCWLPRELKDISDQKFVPARILEVAFSNEAAKGEPYYQNRLFTETTGRYTS